MAPTRCREGLFRAPAALAFVVVAAVAQPATGKLCPYGRFAVTPQASPGAAMVLRLDDAGATLEGQCGGTAALHPRSYPDGVQIRLRARWPAPCGPSRLVKMRARFAPPCDTIVGVLRSHGGRKMRFTATRIAECGDGHLDAGEACDDGNVVGGDCCAPNCQAEPGCFIPCERTADCNPVALCMRQPACGSFGSCAPVWYAFAPPYDPCADGPVCGCDGRTYASSCDAWAAGVTVKHSGTCP